MVNTPANGAMILVEVAYFFFSSLAII
jgi:hypothetical protein